MKYRDYFRNKAFEIVNRIKNIKKRFIYCVAIGIVLAVLSAVTNKDSIYVRQNEIERSSYGTQKTPYDLRFDVPNLSKNMEFSVSVSARKYTMDEADEIFRKKFEELKISILNQNADYEHISKKLNFEKDLGDGIRASYSFEPKQISDLYEKYATKKRSRKRKIASKSSASTASEKEDIDSFRYYVEYQGMIDGNGNINNKDFKEGEFCTGLIEIQLSTEVKEKEGVYKSEKVVLPVRIESIKLSPIESFTNAYRKKFEEADKEYIDKDTVVLPTIVDGYKVNYKDKKDLGFLLLPLFGVLVALLLEARDRENEKEKIKKKIRTLELDFSQIITKILLYVSSGMTIRNSFIRLAKQYQIDRANNNIEERIAYEELVIVKNKLASGYSEISAYEEMAKNINMRIYTRFLNVIIQSIKNGNKDLKNILNMEVQDALYERKQHAKKLGEEASTKLVLPLMMMLSIIMVVIMVPAFMGM